MKSAQNRWIRSSRVLGLFAIAGALGGITLVSRPTPAGQKTVGGGPLVVKLRAPQQPNADGLPGDVTPRLTSLRAPLQPNANGLLEDVTPRLTFPRESDLPTDRCMVNAPRVDDRFSIPAPRVDDRFVVPARVRGLPVSDR